MRRRIHSFMRRPWLQKMTKTKREIFENDKSLTSGHGGSRSVGRSVLSGGARSTQRRRSHCTPRTAHRPTPDWGARSRPVTGSRPLPGAVSRSPWRPDCPATHAPAQGDANSLLDGWFAEVPSCRNLYLTFPTLCSAVAKRALSGVI